MYPSSHRYNNEIDRQGQQYQNFSVLFLVFKKRHQVDLKLSTRDCDSKADVSCAALILKNNRIIKLTKLQALDSKKQSGDGVCGSLVISNQFQSVVRCDTVSNHTTTSYLSSVILHNQVLNYGKVIRNLNDFIQTKIILINKNTAVPVEVIAKTVIL